MPASFPDDVKDFGADKVDGQYIYAEVINELRAEVVALETYLISSPPAGGNLLITFDATNTISGQNKDRTSGGTYTAHRAYINIDQPIKLHSVRWDVSSAKTYALKIYNGWMVGGTPLADLGTQTTTGRTAEVYWDAGDIFLMRGRYLLELSWTGAAVVDDNNVNSPNYFDFFSIERTQYDNTFDTAFSAAIKLDAFLGTESIA